jgi:hypothetical protein
MVKRASCAVAVLAIILAICGSAEACGKWRCRHRPSDVCPPPNEQPGQHKGADYIVVLATSIANAALRVHEDKTLTDPMNKALKDALLEEFNRQIGRIAFRPDELNELVGRKRKIQLEDLPRFGGEVRKIAIQLGESK